MPSNIFTNPFGGGGRGEGGVLGLGPAQNTFGDSTTANRAAAETLRDTYATNNANWLAQYNDDLGLWIRLVWNGGVAEQRRDSAGSDWEDVTNVIRGQAGTDGTDGAMGMPGAPGGGAWNSIGSHTQTADHASNVFVATGITVPANREILGYRIASSADDLEDNLGIAVLDATHIFASTASTAGSTSADATRVRLPEFGGGGVITGSIHAGYTASREILISTSNANQNFAVEFYELVPEATIVDVTGVGPPNASADTLLKIFLDAEIPRLWFTHTVPVYTNDPSGTFNEFVDNDPTGGVYLGDTTSVPSGTHNDDDYYYRHGSTHGWYQQSGGRFRQRSSSTVLGATTTWLGDAQDADTALRRIDNFDMNRRYMFFNVGADRVEILDNSTFTAQTATLTYEYGTLEGRAAIAAWAERTNTQLIPFDKMPFVWQNSGTDLSNVQTINFGDNLVAVVDANGVMTITGMGGGGGGLTTMQVQALIDATPLANLQGQVEDGQIPAGIFRDSEFTEAAVRGRLGLTQTEAEALLIGDPTISGNTVTFTRNDGTTVDITIPEDGEFLFGSGVPDAALGINGDAYLDTDSGIFYKKAAGAWGQQYVISSAPTTHATLYFGTSADATPTGAELTIAGSMGMGTVPAYAGNMYLLIARLESEGDIVSVLFSDDASMTNQVGAFTKFGTTVMPTGETDAYSVWVSNQALTQGADLTITVR